MKALYKIHAGDGGVQMKDTPVPEIRNDEVLVKVAFAGICGTDMHVMRDEYDANLPVIMGHEFSGTVERAGATSDLQPGERVVAMTPGYTCGKCRYCLSGRLLQCKDRKSIGSGMDGCMAEYVVVKADRTYRIPENVSFEEAALTEPIGCCVRSVIETSRISAGDYVYVSGPGTIGQLVAQLAKLSGTNVTVGGTSQDADRLALAKRLGADQVIDVMQEDVFAAAQKITGGEMFDLVFECAGAAPSANTCLKLLRKCGQYVQVGLFGKTIPFDMDHALINEKHIVNSFAAERTSFVTALRLLQEKKLKLDDLISAVYPLEEWEDAFNAAFGKVGYKILLRP